MSIEQQKEYKKVEGDAFHPNLKMYNENWVEVESIPILNDELDKTPVIGNKKSVTQVEQTCANCGFFAAAMAFCSLYNITDKNKIKQIAEKMESGELGKLSALGDMYSAGALSIAISSYVDRPSKKIKKKMKMEPKLKARVYSFCDEQGNPECNKFKEAIKECCNVKNLRVLVPYYAADDCLPKDLGESGGRLDDTQMGNAHWCVVTDVKDDGSLEFIEGNFGKHTSTMDAMFRSNNCLGDRMNWTTWINSETDIEDLRYIVKHINKIRNNKIKQFFKKYINKKKGDVDVKAKLLSRIKEKKNSELYSDAGIFDDNSDDITEIVDLRGKMIVIGFRDPIEEKAEKVNN